MDSSVQQAEKQKISRVMAGDPHGGPPPAPDLGNRLIQVYVRIGGYVGLMLAGVVFLVVCGASAYFLSQSPHGIAFYIIAAFITMVVAGCLGVSTFVTSSVLWLPMLGGLALAAPLMVALLHRVQAWHH